MGVIALTIAAVFIFLGCVMLLWTVIQITAEKRLGARKLGCKGAVRGEQGELSCCRENGAPCEESEKMGQTEEPPDAPKHP